MTPIQVYYTSALYRSLRNYRLYALRQKTDRSVLCPSLHFCQLYGSFFLAGQRFSRLLVIEEPGHYVRRMFVSQTQKRRSIFMALISNRITHRAMTRMHVFTNPSASYIALRISHRCR